MLYSNPINAYDVTKVIAELKSTNVHFTVQK